MESAKHLYEVEEGNSVELIRSRERSIKVRKFLFNILWRFEVMEENPKDGGKGGGDSTLTGLDRVKHMAPTFFMAGQKHLCSEILESQ